MQTFLPYKDYERVAEVLDSKRLNKQILECYQILNVLSNPDPRAGWRNHPAVKMWRGHEFALWDYVNVMIIEATNRGIKTDRNLDNITRLRHQHGLSWGMGRPKWMGMKDIVKRVTTTHKANLFKKQPEAYPQFIKALDNKNNVPCCDTCQYFWVTHYDANLV
jgi:hypothetical protein